MRITVNEGAGERLDSYLSGRVSELSRSRIQALIKSGHIRLNGEETRARTPVASGDEITIEIPEPESCEVIPQDIPLDVLFEDEDVVVLNKPPGLVVHPAAGNPDGTLVNALLFHCQGELPGIGGVERPGIVHRLDKDTSGCLVAAKTERAQHSLIEQFSERKTSKLYLCVTQAPPKKDRDTIFTHLGRHPVARQKMAVVNPGSGRPAITDYYTLRTMEDGTALVLCLLHTGRTHQIRVHMKHVGAPLIGDPIYASPSRQPVNTGRLMLHAWRLGFFHPAGRDFRYYEAPLPSEFHPFIGEKVERTLALLRKSPADSIPERLDATN